MITGTAAQLDVRIGDVVFDDHHLDPVLAQMPKKDHSGHVLTEAVDHHVPAQQWNTHLLHTVAEQ